MLLHLANYGYLDGYKLVSEMAGTRNPSNSAGITPLKLAVKMGHLEIVKYIIEDAGGNPENLNPKDYFGETPLHHTSILISKVLFRKMCMCFNLCYYIWQEFGNG